jgi:hypothetical protein
MWSIGCGWRTRDWPRCNAPVNSEQHRRGPRAPSSFLRPKPSSRGACPQPRHREELATWRSSLPLVIPDLIRYPLTFVIPDLIRYPCFADGPRVFARGDIALIWVRYRLCFRAASGRFFLLTLIFAVRPYSLHKWKREYESFQRVSH